MNDYVRRGIAVLCIAGIFLIAALMTSEEGIGDGLRLVAVLLGVAGLWQIARGVTAD